MGQNFIMNNRSILVNNGFIESHRGHIGDQDSSEGISHWSVDAGDVDLHVVVVQGADFEGQILLQIGDVEVIVQLD